MSELRDYIDIKLGNIPLIISVPHGGLQECDSIPQRSVGVLGIDKGTIILAKSLIEEISYKFKRKRKEAKAPFYISSKIRRSKIDFNRTKHDAYNQTSFLAREIYEFYHNKIQDWIYDNLKRFNRSLLIDIHGFEKDARPPGFRDVEIILGTNNLGSFFSDLIPKRDWGKNLRGRIIQRFLQLDIPIAPGHPRRREYALAGGYITKQYGASSIPKSQAMQIEFSDRIRIFDTHLREIVIKTLGEIFFEDLILCCKK
jgi:N-formylglutamate amidohydrolase